MAKKKHKRTTSLRTGFIEDIVIDIGEGQSIKIGKIDHDGDFDREKETLRAVVEAATRNKSHKASPSNAADATPLSEVISEYCTEKTQSGSWRAKTEAENRAIYETLKRIIGDKPIASIGYADIRGYKSTLLRLPSNMNKSARYRDRSIEEIMSMSDVKPMSTTTINKNLSRASSFFDWTAKRGSTAKNFAEGLTIKTNKRPDQQRDILTTEELQAIFDGHIYKGQFPRGTRAHSYQFWIPLVALFIGTRIEEVCKLHTDDIRQVDNVWCIDIKNTKTAAGERLIPIHQQLLELGLVEFASIMKEQGEERLFPELKKQRDGHSQAASKWFARYRKQCGIGNSNSKKTFHSFRHCVADNLKQQGDIPREHVAAILGHASNDQTFGRYAKQYQPPALMKVVNAINYPDLDLSHISFEDFQQRRGKHTAK